MVSLWNPQVFVLSYLHPFCCHVAITNLETRQLDVVGVRPKSMKFKFHLDDSVFLRWCWGKREDIFRRRFIYITDLMPLLSFNKPQDSTWFYWLLKDGNGKRLGSSRFAGKTQALSQKFALPILPPAIQCTWKCSFLEEKIHRRCETADCSET